MRVMERGKCGGCGRAYEGWKIISKVSQAQKSATKSDDESAGPGSAL